MNELIVVKRSGQRVSFNSTKIAVAIKNAFEQVAPINSEKKVNKVYEDVVNYIAKSYDGRKTINVEDIQDIIERKLKENNYKDVYEAFKDYRIRRAASRQAYGIKQQHKFTKAIERIINSENYLNGNPSDILLNFGKTISCEYTKTYVLDNKLARAHEEGSIYIHNLDYFNLGKLSSTHLNFESTINDTFPNEFIQMATLAKSEIDGEIGINSLDELIKPLIIRKFKKRFKTLLEKYLEIAFFKDYIDLNKVYDIIDRNNGINLELEKFNQFILNKRVEEIFSMAIRDSLLYIRYFLEKSIHDILNSLNNNNCENKKYSISIGGCGNYECLIINNIYFEELEKLGVLDNVTTIFKVSSETETELLNKVCGYIIKGHNIAISNIDASYNNHDIECVEYFSNGKRIFENPIYDTCGSTGRMITSSISINMGRLGLKYQGKDISEFNEGFSEVLELAKAGLTNIFEIIGDKTKRNYRVIFNGNIIDDDKLEVDQKIRKVIKKGVLNLELAGLRECVLILSDNPKKQKELIEDILNFAKDKCNKYSEEAKLNFVLSETTKHRPLKKLMEIDKAIYGIRKNVTDKEMYSRLEKAFDLKKDLDVDFEYIGKYQRLLNGGNLVKVELSKSAKVKNVLEVIELMQKHDIGFLKIVVDGR